MTTTSSTFGMFTSFDNINLESVFKMSEITPKTQQQLGTIYTLLTATVLAAAAGCYAESYLHMGGLLSALGAIGLLFLLGSGRGNPSIMGERLGYLLGFGFLKGMSIAPLVNLAVMVDPSIVLSAFLGTVAIFASFSLSALFSKRRSQLYLGGFLGSALSLMLLLSFLNLFFASEAIFNLQLYGGLLVFSLFVIFDTQLIVEKLSFGVDQDLIYHALTLFIDFVALFVRILIILLKNNKRGGERRNDNNRRRR